jgi:hypothetical protein
MEAGHFNSTRHLVVATPTQFVTEILGFKIEKLRKSIDIIKLCTLVQGDDPQMNDIQVKKVDKYSIIGYEEISKNQIFITNSMELSTT